MEQASLGLFTRVWLAWIASFRILFSGVYAARVRSLDGASDADEPPRDPALPEKAEPPARDDGAKAAKAAAKAREEGRAAGHEEGLAEGREAGLSDGRAEGAALVLALLQEGRLVDFLRQDVASFEDADIGAAARVVHEGCNKALRGRVEIEPVFTEKEGAKVSTEGKPASQFKLTGQVKAGITSGTLRHKGWRVATLALPRPTDDFDRSVLAKAEVEV